MLTSKPLIIEVAGIRPIIRRQNTDFCEQAPTSVFDSVWHGSFFSRKMRSAPGVWYTGGYYEKIYHFDLRNPSQELSTLYQPNMYKI